MNNLLLSILLSALGVHIHSGSDQPTDTHSYGRLQHPGCGSGRRGLRGESRGVSGAAERSRDPTSTSTSTRTFDGDAFAGPLLLEGGEALPLADADDVLLEVELLGVEAQQAQPQLPHRLRVGLQLRQDPVLERGKNTLRPQTRPGFNQPASPHSPGPRGRRRRRRSSRPPSSEGPLHPQRSGALKKKRH